MDQELHLSSTNNNYQYSYSLAIIKHFIRFFYKFQHFFFTGTLERGRRKYHREFIPLLKQGFFVYRQIACKHILRYFICFCENQCNWQLTFARPGYKFKVIAERMVP